LASPGDEGAAPTPRGGLLKRALSASAIEVSTYGLAQIIRLASSMILTRILFPEAFGVMAMLTLVLFGLQMLSDVGIVQAVIQNPRGDDPRFLHTAFTLQAIRGVGLWGVAALLAWPMSLLFHEPALLWIMPAGAVGSLLYGLTSMRHALMRRHLRPLPIAIIEISAQLAAMLTTVVGAKYLGLGVAALVLGSLTNSLVHTGGSYLIPHPHRDRFGYEAEAKREIFGFGRWIFLASAVTFVAGRGDQFVLGRLLGAANLGLYNIALTLAEAPEALGNRVIAGVLYPLYSRVHQERPEDLARVYYRTRLMFDAVLHTSLGGLYALSPLVIDLLYDERYQGAYRMLQVLALRTAFGLMAVPCETCLTARGSSVYGFRRNAFVAVSVLVLLPLGHLWWGVEGVLWATAVSRVAALVALWPAARAHGILRLSRELLVLVFLGLGFGLGSGLSFVLGKG
ncbi:MAG TPA: oligosaccharide flippase family protein, partial [Polyangiales bacterium]